MYCTVFYFLSDKLRNRFVIKKFPGILTWVYICSFLNFRKPECRRDRDINPSTDNTTKCSIHLLYTVCFFAVPLTLTIIIRKFHFGISNYNFYKRRVRITLQIISFLKWFFLYLLGNANLALCVWGLTF
jgi:hypothetical protein